MRIAILGAGGHGKVIWDLILRIGKFEIAGFFDRKFPHLISTTIPLIGTDADLINDWEKYGIDLAVVAIGNNQIRKIFFQQLVNTGLVLPTLIHPSAIVSQNAWLGPGTVVCGNAFIGPGVVIGPNCIINTGANVDHDCILADNIHICPGVNLAGGVKIGNDSMIGTGANIIPEIQIGSEVTIGAGSAVIRDIPDKVTVVGVPARIIWRGKEI